MLHALAALQNDKPLVARNALKYWLRSAALKRVCVAGGECMAHARTGGVHLIENDICTRDLASGPKSVSQHGSDTWSLASQSQSASRTAAVVTPLASAQQSASWE